MALLGDRVQETTTTVGTGTFALNGAVTGYITFNSGFINGDIVWYVCDDGNGNWEIGTGTVGTGTLTRTVFQSSNANALVSFAAGAKRVFCTAPYTYLLPDQTGNTGKILTTDGSTPSWTTPASGTVTAVSVATSNGLAGSSSGGATPQLTLSTTVTGLLKGNGTAISAATAGTDYAGISTANTFTAGQTISVSSSSDALRITQTGAGNALVVEDSANPDSTPFVVSGAGNVTIGYTGQLGGYYNPALEVIGADPSASGIGQFQFGNDGSAARFQFNKTRGTTASAHALVSNSDQLGTFSFQGSDGTQYIRAAEIGAFVDGTPGTNDMPGRLVFSTTKDGASSPTEAMRIDNQQRVGIGGAPSAGINLYNNKQLTGATAAYGILNQGQIQSDVTGAAYLNLSQIWTAAASFTCPAAYGYFANQGTIGAGSTLTNQYGFFANSNLTGATNNYGFYSNIASGSGRYNFYAAGTADNYFAGALAIAGTDSREMLNIGGHTSTATGIGYFHAGGTLPATATSYVIPFHSEVTTPASATTFAELTSFKSQPATTGANSVITTFTHYDAVGPTLGSGSSIGTQYGYIARATLTGATNNYGFYSNIASGTGRYNFYAAGTADNYFAGKVGIGTTPASNYGLLNAGSWTGSSVYYGFSSQGTFQSDVTSQGNAIRVSGGTAATAFTLTTLNHVIVEQGTFGAGSTVSNQIGFHASNSLTGATANYGFYSNIASGTGRYNFYAAGTADNYFAGNLGLGGSAPAGWKLRVSGNITGATTANQVIADGVFQSDVTGIGRGFCTVLGTQAAAFTLPNMTHYLAYQTTIGASSAVTNQYGFNADASLTGATNNYGFYSNIASGTGRWNFYAAGSASNYLGGDLTFKPLASATPASNGDLTFEATSNTSLKIKYKGSDGVVRSATLTLS